MADEKKTTDHKEIQQFAENRDMRPAAVKTDAADGGQHLIRLMQPSSAQSENDNLKEISWDDWFKDFDQNKLALIYDEDSNFNKLVSR